MMYRSIKKFTRYHLYSMSKQLV